ncbi:uncharacterized protein MELLADRAFT_104850 [Melampsora larici-populina 98AG31]|uniref:DUF7918 domain-containing protein n=1 Tax=Melampsora larici-populina (strain 98AG31 / pathotype 3-4-7) TaxID=747676 RepID=F4RFY7_MELLP|nr:uncharacterized protein MELLADRAFT_104850 [Melampsora larici-populina 98AG31]EGG08453.1 hypothetical protein MELLADRAFT_104850 [Melampsora larici-populina 98AG31]
MPHADGIQANIISNGTPLAEYPSPTTAPNTVFCESTPEEDDSHPEQIVKNLGTVSLEFFHCRLGPQKPSGKSFVPSVASTSKFSERNKKASMIPHTIGLGESTIASKARSSTSYANCQIESTPYLRFVWQYRSRSMLITAGLIPRPPSPLPDLRLSMPPRPRPQNHESRPVQGQASSLGTNGNDQVSCGPSTKTTQGEIKPDVKPKTIVSKSVVIDLCDDDDRPMVSFSSLENPIILDDDDDEQTNQSSNQVTQASSSSARKVDVKPAEMKLETRGITNENKPSKQTKRAPDASDVDELDEKRVKVEI